MEVSPDASAPPAESAAPPPVATPTPATPATPPQAGTSSSQPGTSNLSAPATSGPASAVGVMPSSGPGTGFVSDLGDRLDATSSSSHLPFRITATLAQIYDDNIFARPHGSGDDITRLSVTAELTLGDIKRVDGNYLDVVYAPALRLYARNSREDGVDQYADFVYGHHFSRLTLSLEQFYSSIRTTDASIGNLVTSDVYMTRLKAEMAYSTRLDLVASVKQDFTSYDEPGFTNSKEWVGDLYALYHIDPRLALGFGPRIGYLSLDLAPDETYQQVLARANYTINDELAVQGVVGGEDRQYDASRSDTLSPIFELSGTYQPFISTIISFNAARHYRPSYNLLGQNYIASNVNLAATQRFFAHYYFDLIAGFENDDYQAVTSGAPGPTREDNYFFINPSLHWKPNGWLDIATFYKHEEDNSNFFSFSYDANQVGVSCSALY